MSIKTQHFEINKDDRVYLEQAIKNQIMTVEKDEEYWKGWNNAMSKVLELIKDATGAIPNTY